MTSDPCDIINCVRRNNCVQNVHKGQHFSLQIFEAFVGQLKAWDLF